MRYFLLCIWKDIYVLMFWFFGYCVIWKFLKCFFFLLRWCIWCMFIMCVVEFWRLLSGEIRRAVIVSDIDWRFLVSGLYCGIDYDLMLCVCFEILSYIFVLVYLFWFVFFVFCGDKIVLSLSGIICSFVYCLVFFWLILC